MCTLTPAPCSHGLLSFLLFFSFFYYYLISLLFHFYFNIFIYSILFYFILFYSILFYFILFYFILFYSISLYFILFYLISILFIFLFIYVFISLRYQIQLSHICFVLSLLPSHVVPAHAASYMLWQLPLHWGINSVILAPSPTSCWSTKLSHTSLVLNICPHNLFLILLGPLNLQGCCM